MGFSITKYFISFRQRLEISKGKNTFHEWKRSKRPSMSYSRAKPTRFKPTLTSGKRLLWYFWRAMLEVKKKLVLMCFEEGEGDNVYYSFQCMSWNETCVLTFSTKCLSKDCRPSCTHQKLTLSYHINCLWQIVWSRGWLCLLELRNEKEEHLKHPQACSWSRWVDLGMSSAEGMDLELQRPSPHRALLYKEIFKIVM